MDKKYITMKQALLVINFHCSDNCHTFIVSGGGLLGADCSKSELIEACENAEAIEIAGERAKTMSHGVAVVPKGAKYMSDVVFVETDIQKLEELERSLESKRDMQ